MLKIFRKPYDLYSDYSLLFIYANYYVMNYSYSEVYGESILSVYYHKNVTDFAIELNEHDIIFSKDIQRVIKRFLRISTKEIMNKSFDETNRSYFTSINKRDELKIMILGIRKELNVLMKKMKTCQNL